MGNFRNLHVWKKSKNLAVEIYKLTNNGLFSKDYRFRDQIRAAAISVPSNISEGDELDTDKQSIRHFYISKGSTAEVITQLIIAQEVGYIENDPFNKLVADYEHVSHMLAKLIRAREASNVKKPQRHNAKKP